MSVTLGVCAAALFVAAMMLGVCIVEVTHAIRAATLQRKGEAERLERELHGLRHDVATELGRIGRQLTESAPTGTKIVR